MARFLGFILRIDHSLDVNFKTIVICKYIGLGSIIQATPLIQTLRKKYPQAKIVFVTMRSNATLIKYIPEVDETVLISDKNIWSVFQTSVAFVRKMWKIKPDLYIALEFYSNYSGVMTAMSKAKNRLGFYRKGDRSRKGIYNYLVPFSITMPISETYLQFAELLNCADVTTQLKLEVNPTPYKAQLEKKLGPLFDAKYVIVNPNASDLRLERRWPKSYYIETIAYLLNEFPTHRIILIGDKTEVGYVNEIASAIPANSRLVNSAGMLSLDELLALIAGAQLMLTNDTGPMHFAFALNIKTISLFGPCSPQQYGNVNNGITFYKKVHCSPCVHLHLIAPCHGDNICMKNIRPDEVKEALVQSLS